MQGRKPCDIFPQGLQALSRDGRTLRSGLLSLRAQIGHVRGGGVPAAAGARAFRWPQSGTACVGMPSSVPWQKGRQAGTALIGLQAPSIARSHPRTAWLLGPPTLGSGWVPGPPTQGQPTLRPARLQTPKEDKWHSPGHTGVAKIKVVPGLAQGSPEQPRSEGSAASQVARGGGECPGEEGGRPPPPAVCRLPAVPAQPAPRPGTPGTAMGWSTGTSPRHDDCWGPGVEGLDGGSCCLTVWGQEVLGAGQCLPGQEQVGGQWGWAGHQLWTSHTWWNSPIPCLGQEHGVMVNVRPLGLCPEQQSWGMARVPWRKLRQGELWLFPEGWGLASPWALREQEALVWPWLPGDLFAPVWWLKLEWVGQVLGGWPQETVALQ